MTQQQERPVLDYAAPPVRGGVPISLSDLWNSAGMLVVFAVLFAGCSIFVPNFFGKINLIDSLALSITNVGIVACTMLFCLAAGDFDLSVGSVVALSGVIATLIIKTTAKPVAIALFGHHLFTLNLSPDARLVLGISAGILAGGLVGLINGFIIAKLGINALITTLATMQITRGLAYVVSDGLAIGVSHRGFDALGSSTFLSVPMPVWIMAGCFVIFGLLLHKTVFGRNTLAIGGNREAARLAGINVARTKIAIFTLQGLMAGFAGIIIASQMKMGHPNSGVGLELQVIAACVLGGVSLTGGIGTILSVIVGALIMGTVQDAMNLLQVKPFYQYIVSGAVLLVAVLIDRFKQARTA